MNNKMKTLKWAPVYLALVLAALLAVSFPLPAQSCGGSGYGYGDNHMGYMTGYGQWGNYYPSATPAYPTVAAPNYVAPYNLAVPGTPYLGNYGQTPGYGQPWYGQRLLPWSR